LQVLHVYKTYLPEDFTGVPRVIHSLATSMHKHGVKSSVLALAATQTGETVIDGHTVHLAKRDLNIASTGLSLSAFSRFKALCAAADVVHYHFPWPLADLMHFYARPSCRTVLTYHSDIVKQKRLLTAYAPLRDHFLRGMDHIVATSPNYLNTSPTLQRFRDTTSVIPIGIGEDKPVDTALVEKWRARLGEDFFLFVGALRYYKGLQFLMSASRLGNFPIVVAGAGDIAPWQQHAGSGVRFVGEISEQDKTALLQLSRAFVFPSHLRSEAYGVSLVEAARAGRAMISTEIGTGTSFVNLNGQTGLVIPPDDADALADAMRTLANNPDAARQYGRNARDRFEAILTADQMAQSYLELYRS
jgi:rhamnosyl/mannosyltransferase